MVAGLGEQEGEAALQGTQRWGSGHRRRPIAMQGEEPSQQHPRRLYFETAIDKALGPTQATLSCSCRLQSSVCSPHSDTAKVGMAETTHPVLQGCWGPRVPPRAPLRTGRLLLAHPALLPQHRAWQGRPALCAGSQRCYPSLRPLAPQSKASVWRSRDHWEAGKVTQEDSGDRLRRAAAEQGPESNVKEVARPGPGPQARGQGHLLG